MDNKITHCNNGFWNGFFVGGVFGAFILFMFSDPKGKKQVKKLIQKAEDLFEEHKNRENEINTDNVDDFKKPESLSLRLKKRLFTKNGHKLPA